MAIGRSIEVEKIDQGQSHLQLLDRLKWHCILPAELVHVDCF